MNETRACPSGGKQPKAKGVGPRNGCIGRFDEKTEEPPRHGEPPPHAGPAGSGRKADCHAIRHDIYKKGRVAYLCSMYGTIFQPGRLLAVRREDLRHYDAPRPDAEQAGNVPGMDRREKTIRKAYKKGRIACLSAVFGGKAAARSTYEISNSYLPYKTKPKRKGVRE